MYGQLLEQEGALDTALVYSQKALALRPDDANYQFIVGAQLFRSGRVEESVVYLRQAVEGGPLHYPARYNLGQALARLGHGEEADRYLAEADSIQELLHQITLAEEATTRTPGAVEHWARLGDLFYTAGLYDRAFEALGVAATIEPANLSLQHALARAAMASGKTGDAIQRFKAILSADSSRVEAWINLGLAQAVAGRCPEAKRAWETALRHRPGDPTAGAYLARLCPTPAAEEQ
jgi:tetratricopeptide (TPR) repeat protein